MRAWKAVLAGAFLLSMSIFALAFEGNVELFVAETEAQKHCPSDVVVWMNTPTGIYHLKGMRWYGNTNHGAYVCQKEGDQAGYRATKNGQ
jgi:hypothetical protein